MERLALGTKVRTRPEGALHDDQFTPDGQAARRWGAEGEITGIHGLHYDVWHGSSGGPYYPDEIEVLPPAFECAKYIRLIGLTQGLRMRDRDRMALFMPDAIREVGLEGHPKADQAFHFAWKWSDASARLVLSETDGQDEDALSGVLVVLRETAALMGVAK